MEKEHIQDFLTETVPGITELQVKAIISRWQSDVADAQGDAYTRGVDDGYTTGYQVGTAY